MWGNLLCAWLTQRSSHFSPEEHGTYFIGGWVGPKARQAFTENLFPPAAGSDQWTVQAMPSELLQLSGAIDLVAKIQKNTDDSLRKTFSSLPKRPDRL
jgi:kynureninase